MTFTLRSVVTSAIAAVVLYLVYLVAAMFIAGTLLQVVGIILVLVWLLMLLDGFSFIGRA